MMAERRSKAFSLRPRDGRVKIDPELGPIVVEIFTGV
jgi:hypothetical protein